MLFLSVKCIQRGFATRNFLYEGRPALFSLAVSIIIKMENTIKDMSDVSFLFP